MKLYYNPGACSLSPHILLRELGLPFELERVDTKAGKTEKGTDYRTVNPKGAVPTLELDDGQRLTEGPAIVQYLADLKPETGLVPAWGSMARYRVVEWLNYVTSELHKRFSPLYNPRAPEEWKAILREQIAVQFEYVAGALAGHPFLTGERPTVADFYLFVILSWSRSVQIDLARWPALQEYWKRIAARPSVQEAWRAEGLKK
jgi:glutathione S-transferase